MFCAHRREDAASRGLTAGFGIAPGVSPHLAIGAYRGAGLEHTMPLHLDVSIYASVWSITCCVAVISDLPQLQTANCMLKNKQKKSLRKTGDSPFKLILAVTYSGWKN